MSRRVVVLGGTGFLGRQVCTTFTAAGWDVVAVSRRPPAAVPAGRHVPLDVSVGSTRPLVALFDAERPDVVVNAAATPWGLSEEQLAALHLAVVGRLLGALTESAARPRLVHIGTVLEYGSAGPGAAVDESTPTSPSTPYGRIKLQATRAVLAAARAGTVDARVLRVSNVAGPGAPALSLLGRVAEHLRSARRDGVPAVIRLSRLRARRDYVDVRDVAEAVRAAEALAPPGMVLNIGRGEAVPVRWLVNRLVEISNVPARVVEDGAPPQARAGAAEWLQVDARAARRQLGWAPRHSVDDSLRELWRDVCGDPAPALGRLDGASSGPPHDGRTREVPAGGFGG